MITTKIYGHRNLPYLSYDLLFAQRHMDGTVVYGQPVDIVMQTEEPHSLREPTLRLPLDEAQDLFQQMWDQGFRPADVSGGKAEVDALKAHIGFAEKVALAILPAAITAPRA